ncbi:MAG: hypothetical protein QXV85_10005 [Candidatus Bathyarchaeia archaeon]
MDVGLLKQLDDTVRRMQAENIARGEKLVNRSTVVEAALLKFFSSQG